MDNIPTPNLIPPDMQGDPLDTSCSCGWEGVAFIADLKKTYVITCPRCGLRIFQVTCTHCESGFAYPEKDKHIHEAENYFECDVCHKQSPLDFAQAEKTKGFEHKDIPAAVWKQHPTILQIMLGSWWGRLIILGLVVFILVLSFI